MFASFYLFSFLLWHGQLQDAVFKFRLNILLGQLVADIEGTAHAAGIALAADIFAVLILLVLVQTFCGADAQVAVFQLDGDFILGKARQVDVQLVALFTFADIGLHHVLSVFAVQRAAHPFEFLIEIEVHHIIKQIFTKDARQ